jgi:two-component system, LytTR family, response regulator
MNCLIVGGNLPAGSPFEKSMSDFPYLETIGTCATANEAFAFLQQKPVDLLLVFNELPDSTGLDFLAGLPSGALAILIASNQNDAVRAFELSVADCLVEPFTPARFSAALKRAKEIFDGRNADKKHPEKDFIFVRSNNTLVKIRFDEILWVQALGDYVVFQLEEKKHIVHTKLYLAEAKLPPEKFAYIHRSYIVALDKIKIVEKGAQLILNGHSLTISKSFRAALLERLNLL